MNPDLIARHRFELCRAALRRHRKTKDDAAAYAEYVGIVHTFGFVPRIAIKIANILVKSQQFSEAVAILCKADAASGLRPPELLLKAQCEIALYRVAEAQATLARMADVGAPFQVRCCIHQAEVLRIAGQPGQALQMLKTLSVPVEDQGRYQFAFLCASLACGDMAAAEDLLARQRQASPAPDYVGTLWDGSPLVGKSVVLYCNEGLGDFLAHARYIQALREAGVARITLALPKRLMPLFEGWAVVDDVRLYKDTGDWDADFWIGITTLRDVLGLKSTGVRPVDFPSVSASALAGAASFLEPFTGAAKIGVCWRGNPQYARDYACSTRLPQFAPLFDIPQTQVFSLMFNEGADELRASTYYGSVIDACGYDESLADAAAMIAGMDLVVTIDTAIAHLAASLGKPTWVLLDTEPYVYFPRAGEQTPWYPDMRLFRQATPGNWQDVIAVVRAQIVQHVGRAHPQYQNAF